jgi:hypothetical protein
MSSDNGIIIDRKTFEVIAWQGEMEGGSVIGKGKDLKEAVEIAEKFCRKNEMEYGIRFR